MNLNKIIYDVREALKEYTDDQELSDSYIVYLYGIKRSKYLRQDWNNFQRTVDLSVTQSLCLAVESVSANLCSLNLDCDTIMRTVLPIPKPLEGHIKSAITLVKPAKRLTVPFNFVTKEKAIYSSESPYPNSIYGFLDNDMYLYFVSKSDALNFLECINITGIFEDPLDLLNYQNCCGCTTPVSCFDYDTTDYPLQPHYIDLIRNEIVNEQLNRLKIPEDKINNSTDD